MARRKLNKKGFSGEEQVKEEPMVMAQQHSEEGEPPSLHHRVSRLEKHVGLSSEDEAAMKEIDDKEGIQQEVAGSNIMENSLHKQGYEGESKALGNRRQTRMSNYATNRKKVKEAMGKEDE